MAVIDWRQLCAARLVVKEAWSILGYGPSSSEMRSGLAATSKVVRGWRKSVTISGCSLRGGGMRWAAGGRGHRALCREAAIGRSLRRDALTCSRLTRSAVYISLASRLVGIYTCSNQSLLDYRAARKALNLAVTQRLR